MKNTLYIPPSKRVPGLNTWCKACRQCVLNDCPKTKRSLNTCNNGNSHCYKVIAHVPGTKNGRKTKLLKTKSLNEAIAETIEFREQIKQGRNKEETEIITHSLKETRPTLFIDALAKYIDALHGIGIRDYKAKPRSKKYLKDLIASYEFLGKCLIEKGYDFGKFTIAEFLTDEIVDIIFKSLKVAPSGDTTFNKRLDCYQRFENWLNTELRYPLFNLFDSVERRTISFTSLSIHKDEWNRLLLQITPENGIKPVYNYKRRNKENYFKPWLIDGLQLGLAIGARREEIVYLKFNDIIEENGKPSHILIENLKVNRRKSLTGLSKQYIPYPISDVFIELLENLGYKKLKNTNNYLLAPEIIDNRLRMCDALTKGFNHYYGQLNTGRKLTFKCLRKTNITALHSQNANRVKPIHHSGIEVEEKHYLDKEVMAKNRQGFNIFTVEIKNTEGEK